MLHFYRILRKWCLRSSNNGLYALSSLLIRKIRRIRLQFWITLESGKINIPVTKNNEWDSSEFNLFNIYHYYSYYFYNKQCKYCFKNVVKSKWYSSIKLTHCKYKNLAITGQCSTLPQTNHIFRKSKYVTGPKTHNVNEGLHQRRLLVQRALHPLQNRLWWMTSNLQIITAIMHIPSRTSQSYRHLMELYLP